MINFLVEISREKDTQIVPIRTNRIKNFQIFEIDIRIPNKDSYWVTVFGGNFDNYSGNDIELYYGGQYLSHVDLNSLTSVPYSMYNDGNGFILINIPLQYWFYDAPITSYRELEMFTSSAINPSEPSNAQLGINIAQTRLQLPNFSVKLSDNFNGISLNQGFSVDLINNDGYFDNDDYWILFNTPLSLKKSFVDIPTYNDFKRVRSGLIDYVSTNFGSYQIKVADKFNSLENPACSILEKDTFIGLTVDNSTVGKSLPILYGYSWVKLLKIDDTHYCATEKITTVYRIIDKDGNIINWQLNNNIITVPANSKPDSAYIRGYEIDKIGGIIIDLMSRADLRYLSTYWDKEETDRYLDNSKQVNFLLTSGNIKKAIQDLLVNDMAYLLQKPDDRFTIRKYGETYKTYNISPQMITKQPEKDYSKSQENYFSSCVLEYTPNNSSNMSSETSFLLYNENEFAAKKKYKKNVQQSFKTNLRNENDVIDFGKILSDRYSFLKQKIKLPVGIDTSQMELLDIIEIDMNINERQFSNKTKYIITEINPAQDILTLEEF